MYRAATPPPPSLNECEGKNVSFGPVTAHRGSCLKPRVCTCSTVQYTFKVEATERLHCTAAEGDTVAPTNVLIDGEAKAVDDKLCQCCFTRSQI